MTKNKISIKSKTKKSNVGMKVKGVVKTTSGKAKKAKKQGIKKTVNLSNNNITTNSLGIENTEEINNTNRRSLRNKPNLNYNIEEVLKENYGTPSSIKISSFSPMLADTYDGSQDISDWLMSEKLDGIRSIWDGKNLYSRNNNQFYPPEDFIKNFPKDFVFDGELFLERNSFSETVSIVKKKEAHDGWLKIKYIVFDAPFEKGTLSERLKRAEEKIKESNSPYIVFHGQEICKGREELEKKMDEIVGKKGEGIIVRDPKSIYENRRSDRMLKVKRFHDAEATVIGHIKGEGRCSGMLGALLVKNDQGIEFKIGTGFDNKQRMKPPKIGSVVTYRYFELSKDKQKPRFPSFVREHPGM